MPARHSEDKTMKKTKLLLTIVLIVCLTAGSCITVSAATSGSTGSCSWLLNGTTLMISATSANDCQMADYAKATDTPWYNAYASSITSVVISGTVSHIGNAAFNSLTKLKSVSINSDSKKLTIGTGAFIGCTALTSITIPENVTSIGGGAFAKCSSLSTVNFNATKCETMGTLTSPVFYQSPVTAINFGSNVKYIPDYAFRQSSSFVSPATITIPESVYYIGEYAFAYNMFLKTVNLPDKLTSLPQYMFYGCKALTTINTPKLLNTLGNYVFYDCLSLTAMDLPATVSNIGYGAFEGCSALKITTTYGSYAEAVAKEYGIPYTATGGSSGGSTELTNNTHSTAILANGYLSVTVAMDEPISGECIHAALYNSSNEIVNYHIASTPTSKTVNAINIQIPASSLGSATYLKVFIWDSLKTCRPVSPAEKIIITR